MQEQSIVHWKDKALSLYCICFLLLIFGVSGCGEDYSSTNDDNDTGSYACSIKWPEDVPTLETTSSVSRSIDCSANGILTVRFSFYNGSGDYLTGNGFDCSLGRGTVSGIPAGSNIRLIVTGEDSSENVLYRGERNDISIVAGQTTDDSSNPIQMERVVPPDIPISVGATAGDGQITISWDDVLDETSYNIYWSTSSGVTIATDTEISNVTSPYTHTGRTNGTTYYYVVTAENSYGESANSNEVNAIPISLSITTTEPATLVTSNSAMLNGTVNPNGDSTTYYFEYGTTTSYGTTTTSTSAGSGTSAVSVNADISSLNPKTTYHYRVVATNSVGTTYGADQSFTTLVNAPTNIRTSSGAEKVTIFWDDVSGATSYNIYWARYTGVSKVDYEGIISNATSPYAHNGLINDTTYYYVVTAENSYGESDESSEVNARPSINLAKTGQTTCYDSGGNAIDCANTGQDGDIQAGVEWPAPRFTDNSDGTITDNLTGLMWLKDANCFGNMTWQAALDNVKDLNNSPGSYTCGGYNKNYTDWRLPNINELESLVNAEEYTNSWLNTQGFTNVQSSDYWSSSTIVSKKDDAWKVSMYYGSVRTDDESDKSDNHYVWSVRSGQ